MRGWYVRHTGGVNPNQDFARQKWQQKRGYDAGYALASHIDTCHGGVFDEKCNACIEIKKKLDKIEENKK